MNKIPMVVIGLGIIITLIGIIVLSNLEEDAIETAEEGLLYEGADGEMKITGKSNPNEQGFGLYVHIESTYEGGGEGGFNEERGNNTWDLTESDCDLVRSFTLTHNEDGTQVFIPRCNYIEDDGGSADDDDWIAVGTLCTQQMAGDRNRTGDGCPDGSYTWDTGGEVVMVYDIDKLIEGLIGAVIAALGSFGACCCGVIVLIIGIILAFTMDDPETRYAGDNQDSNLFNQGTTETGGVKASSGWDEKEDYIRKEETEEDEETKEEEPESNKREGEYEIPPPPE
jgi:hypothetical protein